jgi:hypothetical protein
MKNSALGPLSSACLCGALLVGCAGGGSSSTHAAEALPATGSQLAGRAPLGGVRRTQSVPTCSGVGTNSFLGGTDANVAAASDSAVLGGQSNQTCDDWSSIGGGDENRIGSSGAQTADDSFIGGGEFNVISGAGEASFIGAGDQNVLTGQLSALVGGLQNGNGATYAMLGAGENNHITSGGTQGFLGGGNGNTLSALYGAIAAGISNTVSGEGGYVAAGGYNTASGVGAVIDGGFNSTAAGNFATIPGGYVNSAAGTYSFAAGARASAAQTGTFVWSDGSDGDAILTSTRAYQFLARASGGVTFWTNAASTVGAMLAPGSGTWASASDRNLKTDIARIDDAAVLDKVATLPIERWSYKSERSVRHVGPMAQDFYAAFGVGEDDKHITSIDEDGIALAAIKALHSENADARAAVKALRAENAALRAQLDALKTSQARRDMLVDRRLERLTAVVSESRAR